MAFTVKMTLELEKSRELKKNLNQSLTETDNLKHMIDAAQKPVRPDWRAAKMLDRLARCQNDE